MDTLTNYGELHQLFDDNFIDYTSYVVKERAIPDIADGFKPVQRRILQTLFNMDDGRFHKVANVVGSTMKLHPHGDASIFAALVNLANKGYLIDRQGNYGNIYTGDQASAARYIECRLSPLARETIFNKDLTEFVDSYDGRMLEPVALPAKIPLLLMQGAEGIAVGMATKIMPHNFVELLEAQIRILQGKEFEFFPDFLQGGYVDVSGYDQGNGRIKCRAKIIEKNEKTIVIKELPYTTTTQSLIESIEKAARSNRIKILSIDDYTAEEVEIEIKLARGIYAADTIRALYAFTDCEVPITPNLTLIKDNSPVNISVNQVLEYNTHKLVGDLEHELNIELSRLKEKLQHNLLEQIFIEERLYKKIEECKSYPAILETVENSLQPYLADLVREITKEDIERLLEIRIKRISRYDIDKKRKDIKEINENIKEVTQSLTDMVGFTINYIKCLLKRYGNQYPRKTEITTFTEVQARKVALSNLTVTYDEKDGFLGYQVKGNPETAISCSEYDKVMLLFKHGLYKIINVTEKTFVGADLLWFGKVDEKLLFNVVYKDGEQDISYLKRFHMPKFILEKEYRLFTEHSKSNIQILLFGEEGSLRCNLVPSKRTRTNTLDLEINEFLVKGASAIGKRISTRPVRRITEIKSKKIEIEVKAKEVAEEPEVVETPMNVDIMPAQEISEEKKAKPIQPGLFDTARKKQ
ncbi:MAG: DNA topoisomerase IV subunit A [Proteobacteria bacterium]|nr:DNA topoisomerase IV subunit A [Pseudomonadota bacterium]